jgi:hypothetical protein
LGLDLEVAKFKVTAQFKGQSVGVDVAALLYVWQLLRENLCRETPEKKTILERRGLNSNAVSAVSV